MRSKSSAVGFLWSLLNPLGMMLVFTFVFTVMWPNAQMQKYPLFLLCGLLPWNFFSAGVMTSINSIVGNANLVKKVYFPRGALPMSMVLANSVNFLLGLVVLFVVLVVFRARFSPLDLVVAGCHSDPDLFYPVSPSPCLWRMSTIGIRS